MARKNTLQLRSIQWARAFWNEPRFGLSFAQNKPQLSCCSVPFVLPSARTERKISGQNSCCWLTTTWNSNVTLRDKAVFEVNAWPGLHSRQTCWAEWFQKVTLSAAKVVEAVHLLRRSRRPNPVDFMVESSDEFFMALSVVEPSHPIPTYSYDSRDCGKC